MGALVDKSPKRRRWKAGLGHTGMVAQEGFGCLVDTAFPDSSKALPRMGTAFPALNIGKQHERICAALRLNLTPGLLAGCHARGGLLARGVGTGPQAANLPPKLCITPDIDCPSIGDFC